MHYTASTVRRLLAYFIDTVIIGVLVGIPVSIELFRLFLGEHVQISWLKLGLLLMIPLSLRFGFLMALGATPGKWLMGLRVVDAKTQSRLAPTQALIRSLNDFLPFFFSYAPQVVAFFRADRRQLGDLLAHTRVIQFDPPISKPSSRPFFATLALFITLSSASRNLISHAEQFSFSSRGVVIRWPTIDELI